MAVRWRQGVLRQRLRSPFLAIAAFFAFWVTLSAAFSLDPPRSLFHSPGVTLLLLLPIGMDLYDAVPRARTVFLSLAGSQCAMSLFGLWQYVHDRGADIHERITGTLSHYMTFSGLAMIGGCVLAGFLFEESGRWRWIGLLCLLPFGVLLLTYTRSVWVGTLAGFLVYFAVRKPRGLLVLLPVLVAVYLLVPMPIRDRIRSIEDPSERTNRDRIAMAKAGLHMIRDHPLFGVGQDMVKTVYPQYRVPEAVREQVPHLHDNALQIAAANGLPAAAAYLALAGVFLWQSVVLLRRERRPDRAALLAGAVLCSVALPVAGLFEYNFGDIEVRMATLLVMALPFARLFRTEDA